ncbi:LysR substrate-binding domain-containing protein [Sansalvadorimonas sp. 2012CJ34-2]|uniref:LysR substrate-binding domain-containing protein n=1 Tax=Parendozoicomonas callyspongiae TaxID=2942213 RepID=A0ABT0PD44_9GAMM|nr:LysR substrate-binding domain-containing protein [Sansalvadorimonas sp. 2012CJ34-2]
MRTLPPMKALLAFDAVARNESVTLAGQELGISQSAVSHRLRLLEDFLGETLLSKQGRKLELSEVGKHYHFEVDRILRELSIATGQVMGVANARIRFHVYSSFGIKWLVPLLPKFHSLYPDIDLRLQMDSELPVLSDRTGDAFVTEQPDKPGYYKQLIRRELVVPVCAPWVYQEMSEEPVEEAIWRYPLLSCDRDTGSEPGTDWEIWARTLGLDMPPKVKIHSFSHQVMGIEAAASGQGITLASDFMVEKDIQGGRLVRLPLGGWETGFHVYFCCKHGRMREPAIKALADWLYHESSEGS